MMAIDTVHPAVGMVKDILSRNEVTPVYTDDAGAENSQQWWISPMDIGRRPDVMKILIRQDASHLRVGYQLDKGLSRDARVYNIPARYVMYTDWPFQHLTKDVDFLNTLDSLWPEVPVHVWMRVTNGLVPGFNPFTTKFRHQFHWVVQENGVLSLAEPVYDIGIIGQTQHCTSLPSALAYLSALPEYRWYWISLFFGLDGTDVTETNLHRLLSPFLRWWQ
jgi:hypothetical protein